MELTPETILRNSDAITKAYNSRILARKSLSDYLAEQWNIQSTELQRIFIDSIAFITMFGGAAGGGKSRGLLNKYFGRCQAFKGYKALILRRTFPELKRSLIRVSLENFPKTEGKYHETDHVWKFVNGSTLEFGYCESENDVTNYQSAEYDAIGFDESTHFTEYQITYMISRIRGLNDYPKGIDLTTNPGNVGHAFHKENIIDMLVPFQVGKVKMGERFYSGLFVPAKVTDNKFLMEADPEYIQRLDALGENDRKMLRDGDWDVFAGQYFSEFKRNIHVIEPFAIPKWWRKFRAMDYGMDMLAVPWFAVDPTGNLIIYRELYESGLGLTDAARKVLEATPEDEEISYTCASPDLWKKERKDGLQGKHEADYMIEAGLNNLIKADNSRISGWRNLKEYLKPIFLMDKVTGKPLLDKEGDPLKTARLLIFNTCLNAIRTIPKLIHDPNNFEDVSDLPHEITHMPEAIRYGCMSRPIESEYVPPTVLQVVEEKFGKNSDEYRMIEAELAEEEEYNRLIDDL
jgi:phage terminase large subunit